MPKRAKNEITEMTEMTEMTDITDITEMTEIIKIRCRFKFRFRFTCRFSLRYLETTNVEPVPLGTLQFSTSVEVRLDIVVGRSVGPLGSRFFQKIPKNELLI